MNADYSESTGLQTADWRLSNTVQSDLSRFADETHAAIMETVLGFRVGELGFLLPISLHCEVIERLPVSPVPNVEPWLSGLLNIRGNIVPVVDLLSLLGDTTRDDKKRYLFAIGRGEKTLTLWIDGYPQLLTLLETSLHPLPTLPDRLQPYAIDAYWLNGQIWLRIQFEQLFKTLGRQHAV